MRPRARLRLVARNQDPPEPLTTGAASDGESSGGIIAELRRVAEGHAPEGGYGETAYNEGEGTVYWVPADWSSNEEIDAAHAAFMEIDGVNGVVGDAESALPKGEGWETVWPVPGSEEAYERVLALAQRPLHVEPVEFQNGWRNVRSADAKIAFAARALDTLDGVLHYVREPDETS